MRDGARTFLPYPIKVWMAGFVLAWEQFFPAFKWPLGLIGLFVGLSLIELPQALGEISGGWLQAGLLALFLILFLWSLRTAMRDFSWPDEDRILRRLESWSGLKHRPLSALSDAVAGGGRTENALWRAYLKRLGDVRARVRVGSPAPVAAVADPFGARVVVGLVLILGLVAGWQNPGERLRAAMLPDLSGTGPGAVSLADVWVSPPDYTGRPPILLTRPVAAADDAVEAEPETIAIPVGSRFLATVNGGEETPVLVIEDGTEAGTADKSAEGALEGRSERVAFETIAPESHQIQAPISRGTRLSVTQDGDALAAWQINVLPDLAPSVSFPEAPASSERNALVMRYEAKDDYGVTVVRARIHRLEEGAVTTDDPIEIVMPAVSGERKNIAGRSFSDLTPHPWAGQQVRITLEAEDDIGQTGASDPVDMLLPERAFTHPVARAVIEQRKRLVTEPEERIDISEILLTLAARPHHYFHDTVVFLGLKSAASRLYFKAPDAEGIEALQKLLWDVALRIEDGDVSTALRDLREIERKLQEALAGDASDEEIERLMEEMRQAIDKYLQAMAEQMMKQAQRGDQMERQQVDPNQMLRRDDLMKMLDQMKDMAKTGARDAARQMLSQLQQMMENLRMGMQQQQMSPQQQALQEMMRQLNELSQQQRELMDRTFKEGQRQRGQMPGQQSQRGQRPGQMPGQRPGQQGQQGQQPMPGQSPGDGGGEMSAEELAAELAEMQERLRKQLGEFMRKVGEGLGQIPEGFGQAEQSMRDATEALGENAPGQAVGPQGDALSQMRQGADTLNEALREMANGQGQENPNAQAGEDDDLDFDDGDPLNRRRTGYGFNDNSDVEIPAETDIQRARRIFDELRERSGDRSRPTLELDYIERLLKRF
ncbi:TIGR02302 family protein [Nisaea acidiphila]|uniref:TIGR02302 family protein n=1 Tax=Nisaea acidiphila TaxID=1862145 RepID=A0A9J7ANK7_9PROT|nr:TIGR02302 family protein [Nisaea acidiphila]UUX48177.1 TIGR02302 family protein [Nisaea acidiphila]